MSNPSLTNIGSAMVLAAGRGARMRPLTDSMPKPLVPVAGRALIDWQLDMLADAGIDRVVINSSYLAEMLEEHVAKRTHPTVDVSYEPERLETGGGIAQALPLLGEGAFLSMNSDAIILGGSVSALDRLATAWDDDRYDALMLILPTEKAVGYEGTGDFYAEDNGQLRRRGDNADAPYVFSGMQLLHPRFFASAPEGAFSLNELYNANMSAEMHLSSRIGYVIHDGQWYHVGDVEGVERANQLLQKQAQFA